MCGLFGWYLSEEGMADGDVKLLAAFLGTEMDSRGGDSWGTVDILKGEMRKGLGRFERGRVLKELVRPAILGHTRKATTGKVTVDNAHPFVIGKTVGAHNGIIHNDNELARKYPNRRFEVDSMHLIAHIDEKRPITEISGYGAVTYYNKEQTDQVYLAKGTTGDLHVVGLGKHSRPYGIIWASTYMALTKALAIAGFNQYFNYNLRCGELYKIQNYTLWEEGKFPLSYISRIDSNSSCQFYTGGYRGKTAFELRKEEEEKKAKENLVVISGTVMSGENSATTDQSKTQDLIISTLPEYDYDSARVLSMPEDVKKNQEVLRGRIQEEEKVPTKNISCDGCTSIGPACESHDEVPNGIAYSSSLGQRLCESCTTFWLVMNCQDGYNENRALQQMLRPKLSIVRKENDGTRTNRGYL